MVKEKKNSKFCRNFTRLQVMTILELMSYIINSFKNITTPLKNIFNASITQGDFPNKLKITKITPIFTAGEKNPKYQTIDQYLYFPVSVKFWNALYNQATFKCL